ncbi:enoyl-CoA hydratase/isomerase family protein [Ornithobacterium rhinotracheale]|uniref:enoyl-CoA hydratase/isomerase family protein n=1 Tax=Ornithobacterium rhinotracheale TaxID=28251 RepID=UPI00129C202F|nr:enoyl-CoA hydratase/isomerase family protein [Ornithobacterium rhinotracheale]MRI63200.1 enoyl-CoA hydratase/isomerase family protein [Ornithobacterium rhinotracheale]MRJ08872.1 enoyl-CoA hydratase/isomerase family protein [Ornithobacterium rhinotracheale]UOH77753.1 enoyl-CoA hydratase/isomerase family protein [Ornithobacterium rhinotracheale]
MEAYVKTEIKNKIAYIEFFHPKSNSFPTLQLNELEKHIQKAGKNDDAKLVVLQSRGTSVFCAGASFEELLKIENFEQGKKFFSGFARVILAMKQCPKFIIGAIQGKVVGGGVGLTAACDYNIATMQSQVRLSELSIGIGPFVVEPAVRRKIGLNALSELTLNPKAWKSALWCKEKGLYHKVYNSDEEFVNGLNEFTEQLCQYSPEAMAEIKKVFWQNTENWDTELFAKAAISGQLVLSEFTKSTLSKYKK